MIFRYLVDIKNSMPLHNFELNIRFVLFIDFILIFSEWF